MMKIEKIKINTDYIKLDSLLKFSGICMSGGEAKDAILNGAVLLNGEICDIRGKKIRKNDEIIFNEEIKLIIE